MKAGIETMNDPVIINEAKQANFSARIPSSWCNMAWSLGTYKYYIL